MSLAPSRHCGTFQIQRSNSLRLGVHSQYLTDVHEAVVVRFEDVGVLRAELLLHQSQDLLHDAVVGVTRGDHFDVAVPGALDLHGLVHFAVIEADEETELAALLRCAEVAPGAADGVAVGFVTGSAEIILNRQAIHLCL